LGARDDIERNLERVRARMDEAATRSGRPCGSVRLVAVTKTVSVEQARILLESGVTELGENRVEEARSKVEAVGPTAQWHMIGTVQRRKAGEVVDLFAYVDSVDRLELAEALERKCAERGKVMPVLLEVNVSGEASKHGFIPADLPSALDRVRALPHLLAEGLMTMAPLVDDPNEVRPVFAELRKLAEQMGLKELSMGMSNDFEVAIEEGATQVRIGTALFE